MVLLQAKLLRILHFCVHLGKKYQKYPQTKFFRRIDAEGENPPHKGPNLDLTFQKVFFKLSSIDLSLLYLYIDLSEGLQQTFLKVFYRPFKRYFIDLAEGILQTFEKVFYGPLKRSSIDLAKSFRQTFEKIFYRPFKRPSIDIAKGFFRPCKSSFIELSKGLLYTLQKVFCRPYERSSIDLMKGLLQIQ